MEESHENEDIETEELPEEMQNMTDEEKNQYVEEMFLEREQIQNRINELNRGRREYLDNQMQENMDNTLDSAIINAIHEQAADNNFTFN